MASVVSLILLISLASVVQATKDNSKLSEAIIAFLEKRVMNFSLNSARRVASDVFSDLDELLVVMNKSVPKLTANIGGRPRAIGACFLTGARALLAHLFGAS